MPIDYNCTFTDTVISREKSYSDWILYVISSISYTCYTVRLIKNQMQYKTLSNALKQLEEIHIILIPSEGYCADCLIIVTSIILI